MPLTTGTRLGPYEVVSLLGAGGMGEVYRARDGRLHRDVAIKVLPEDLALDVEQRARFEREAQAVAALSHPNVLAIFDTGEHDGRLYAVTELLEGVTLRELLKRGPLPIRTALDYAVQIARGLAAAHDKQLVHRDLKPENVFILNDGRVKILDFGLARHIVPSAASEAAETIEALTGAGAVLGTVGYMAPEQVRGEAIDARADLFAFGTVLYEMLTGRRAFRRDTAAETMTAILRDEPPDLIQAGIDLPLPIDRIVRHCLEKSPQRRFQTAHDVAFALESLSASATDHSGKPHAQSSRGLSRSLVVSIVVSGIAVVGVIAYSLGWRPWGAARSTTAALTIGAATQVTGDDGLEIHPALSPDGKLLAYAAGSATQMRIYIRPVAGGRTLTLSESGAALEFEPRWSPDGSQILFRTFDGVFVSSSLGGATTRVASAHTTAAAWAPDGKRVLIVVEGAMSVASVEGGEVKPLANDSAISFVHSCDWSPTGAWIACARGNFVSTVPGPAFGNIAPSGIVLMKSTGGPLIPVTENTAVFTNPVWSRDGRQLYFVSNREGPRDIYVLDIAADGTALSAPRRVTTGLGLQSLALATAGNRLAYVAYAARSNIWSMPIPTGAVVDASQAKPMTSSNQVVEALRVSPDRKWLMYDSTLHLNAELFRIPIGGGTPERLSNDPADDFAPDLSPDGREILYHSWRTGTRDVYLKSIDGAARALTSTPAQESYPHWSPDGRALVYYDQNYSLEGVTVATAYLMRRDASGAWSAPVELIKDVAVYGDWVENGTGWAVRTRDEGIQIVPIAGGAVRTVYTPAPGSADPKVLSLVRGDDERTLYFKSRGVTGQMSIWSIPISGGKPRQLVRFTDPARVSIRGDFAVGAGRIFFTIEERQADIWVADIK